MIPASYLYKDALRQTWGRDFVRSDDPAAGPEQPTARARSDRSLITLAFGPKRGR